MARRNQRIDSGKQDREINDVKRQSSNEKSELIEAPSKRTEPKVCTKAVEKWNQLRNVRMDAINVSIMTMVKALEQLRAKEQGDDIDPEVIAILREVSRHAKDLGRDIDATAGIYWDPKAEIESGDNTFVIQYEQEKNDDN